MPRCLILPENEDRTGRQSVECNRRFDGIARLYGPEGLRALEAACVTVVGVGGVGSWAVEALARSALGHLRLIDPDHVVESNFNRQLPATDPAIGRAKVQVLRERVRSINPHCIVETVEEFLTEDNVGVLIPATGHTVLDCIDNFRVKASLIAHCRRRRLGIVTVGGAGGQRDAGRIRVGDLRRTEQDPLLARTRRLLRQAYGFPRNPRRRFGVCCVWSDEPQSVPPAGCDAPRDRSLNCAGFGASMPVTATFGLIAAGQVINRLVDSSRG